MVLTVEDLRIPQLRLARRIYEDGCVGGILDMGLGKTGATLTAIQWLLEDEEVSRVLVIAPLRVAQGVWAQEIDRWAHLRGMTCAHILGTEPQRLRAMRSEAHLHIVNVENVAWLIRQLRAEARALGRWPYDMLVVDESSLFKAANSQRFKALRSVLAMFDRRVILTGTVTPRDLLDIWAQAFIVDLGDALGRTMGAFKTDYFRKGGFKGYKFIAEDDARERVAQAVSRSFLVQRAADFLDLPPLVKNDVWVTLPEACRAQYNELEKELFLELDEGDVDVTHAASLRGKCHQIANGALYVSDPSDLTPKGPRKWQWMHDEKVKALQEILDSTSENVLVVYHYGHDLERLRKAYPRAPVLADCKTAKALDKLQRDWNAGKHPVMFLHAQGAGHGLNLQHGGRTIVFFSLCDMGEAYRQVIERIGPARQAGKVDRVIMHRILCRETVDEPIADTLEAKEAGEKSFVSAVQEYRKRLGKD